MTASVGTWPPSTPIYDAVAAQLGVPQRRRRLTWAAVMAQATARTRPS